MFGSKDANTKESEKGVFSRVNKLVITSSNVKSFLLFRLKDAGTKESENRDKNTKALEKGVFSAVSTFVTAFSSADKLIKSKSEINKSELNVDAS